MKIRKVISIVILTAFITTSVKSPADASVPWMPKPGVIVHLSPEFTPAHLKGMVIHPENSFKFDFIINKGDEALNEEQKKSEYTKLIKYFMASLAVPDEDQWVNLSPYEKDRIIKDNFGKTEMGRDLLAQDYLLKQITSSLIYPEDDLGKKFWERVYAQAQQQFGTTNIPVNTFNKVWIVPDLAQVYEKGNAVFLIKSHLKVMLEEDYVALNKNNKSAKSRGLAEHSTDRGITIERNLNERSLVPENKNQGTRDSFKSSSLASQIVREIVLPALETEVNEGKSFASLRQVFSGMILATWYKRALKESLLGKIYADQSKVQGINQPACRQAGILCKDNEEIYQQYLKAYKKGVFNYIKEEADQYTHQAIPRKYFSGGFMHMSPAMLTMASSKEGDPVELSILQDPSEEAVTVKMDEVGEAPKKISLAMIATRYGDAELFLEEPAFISQPRGISIKFLDEISSFIEIPKDENFSPRGLKFRKIQALVQSTIEKADSLEEALEAVHQLASQSFEDIYEKAKGLKSIIKDKDSTRSTMLPTALPLPYADLPQKSPRVFEEVVVPEVPEKSVKTQQLSEEDYPLISALADRLLVKKVINPAAWEPDLNKYANSIVSQIRDAREFLATDDLPKGMDSLRQLTKALKEKLHQNEGALNQLLLNTDLINFYAEIIVQHFNGDFLKDLEKRIKEQRKGLKKGSVFNPSAGLDQLKVDSIVSNISAAMMNRDLQVPRVRPSELGFETYDKFQEIVRNGQLPVPEQVRIIANNDPLLSVVVQKIYNIFENGQVVDISKGLSVDYKLGTVKWSKIISPEAVDFILLFITYKPIGSNKKEGVMDNEGLRNLIKTGIDSDEQGLDGLVSNARWRVSNSIYKDVEFPKDKVDQYDFIDDIDNITVMLKEKADVIADMFAKKNNKDAIREILRIFNEYLVAKHKTMNSSYSKEEMARLTWLFLKYVSIDRDSIALLIFRNFFEDTTSNMRFIEEAKNPILSALNKREEESSLKRIVLKNLRNLKEHEMQDLIRGNEVVIGKIVQDTFKEVSGSRAMAAKQKGERKEKPKARDFIGPEGNSLQYELELLNDFNEGLGFLLGKDVRGFARDLIILKELLRKGLGSQVTSYKSFLNDHDWEKGFHSFEVFKHLILVVLFNDKGELRSPDEKDKTVKIVEDEIKKISEVEPAYDVPEEFRDFDLEDLGLDISEAMTARQDHDMVWFDRGEYEIAHPGQDIDSLHTLIDKLTDMLQAGDKVITKESLKGVGGTIDEAATLLGFFFLIDIDLTKIVSRPDYEAGVINIETSINVQESQEPEIPKFEHKINVRVYQPGIVYVDETKLREDVLKEEALGDEDVGMSDEVRDELQFLLGKRTLDEELAGEGSLEGEDDSQFNIAVNWLYEIVAFKVEPRIGQTLPLSTAAIRFILDKYFKINGRPISREDSTFLEIALGYLPEDNGFGFLEEDENSSEENIYDGLNILRKIFSQYNAELKRKLQTFLDKPVVSSVLNSYKSRNAYDFLKYLDGRGDAFIGKNLKDFTANSPDKFIIAFHSWARDKRIQRQDKRRSSAMIIESPGGIDLNSSHLNLQIKRDGNGVPLPIDQQDLAHVNIEGLTPVILEIKPASSLLSSQSFKIPL